MHLLHKHSMPPTGPRVMDSPIRPSPPGLERRWKAPGRGHKFFLGCQSLVSGPLGHFPSVIILLASRWPDLTTLLLSFFPLSFSSSFLYGFSLLPSTRFLPFSCFSFSPAISLLSPPCHHHSSPSTSSLPSFYLGLVRLSSLCRPRSSFNPLSPSPPISRPTLLRVNPRET